MASLARIVIILLVIVHFFGQLLRVDFGSINVPLIDIPIIILVIINIYFHHKNKSPITNKPFLWFIIFSWITYFINLQFYPLSLKPILYLLRLNSLISLFVFPLSPQLSTPKLKQFVVIVLFANIIFGFVQYLSWPDLTSFSTQNWDPHLHRLVSTFFDPTFAGLIYLFLIIYAFLNPYFKALVPISYIGLALTYSRSSLLTFFVSFSFLAYKLHRPKIVLSCLIVLVATILLLPRLSGEGTKLERTSSIKAKINNYRQGIVVFLKSPLIGHGYNNLFFAKNITNPYSHANSGFDGSLMTILATTGLIGISLFILGLISFYRHADLLHQTLTITILLHSLFANSLLFPWATIILFLI